MNRVFGSEDTPEFFHKIESVLKPLLSIVEREFINDSASTAAVQRGDVPRNITSLVSFAERREDLQPWERSANVRVVERDASDKPTAVEADLQTLVRDFGAHIAIPVLYGKDFLERNPQFLDDFWRFDNDLFPLLMVGVPPWIPLKIIQDGIASRSRMTVALEGLYRRIDQYQKGDPVDFNADMSDVGIATERNQVYDKFGVSMKHRADMDLSFVWGQNANTQPLVFWFLAYIHSAPGLVEDLRREIAPWVKVATPGPMEISSMDISALHRECPLLKSAIYETYRLGSEATSIRRVDRPITLLDGDHKHQLQPGTFVSAPFSVLQNDASYFPDPEKFVPDRFLEVDSETGRKVARYGKLRPWGVGPASCKGRTFAEKEILTITAALISIWDMEPAEGAWNVPASLPGTGAKKPAKDIRVILRRRVAP
ncbi:hypothetical protein JX265_000364 [Neoarthrinium moseri]|uniref:Cytochrome P450 n=1 Tax=Neoarthrinium moseri TaxID=1658444 RepID=A0A9Q0AUU6_9PEZI|nr:uncharacterized protein JN550_000614 [Neoarthrinium moseri]KAI1851402.1 hypothetical protein JX266_003477 [Neoarthrinium moseri]KAI1878432.1 hypothetical protein JN550_000614 [Neoarthrinium moseri]KAI1881538.1 hypothetical protein JX265_000364 [Neoarthrinium moseri]